MKKYFYSPFNATNLTAKNTEKIYAEFAKKKTRSAFFTKTFAPFAVKMYSILIICVISIPSFAQNCEKGCCNITKTTPDNTLPVGKAKLVMRFIGADGKPVKSHIRYILGRDTLTAKVDTKGLYKIYVRPDTYKLKFKVPFWYIVKKEQVVIKASNTYYLSIKFEAKEIMSGKGAKDGWD